MNKHTPGPWEVLNSTAVFSALGADSGDGTAADHNDGWNICDCSVGVTCVGGDYVELGFAVQKANAKLIAQAPDLLSIARRWAALDGQWHPDRYESEKAELLEDTATAIAKATQ
ncbi:hypothetical protein [Pseudomonas carnis]|uniref:hypothetical protein n=1 Tax=Pseudomonas carnis TaxID=2487355 RepID=UPI0018E73748|nr:hypothetical protein [Pseudomonas carnis]MBJ2203978.1 hypothetical protein [Pseudomonas carnis]